MPELQTFQPQAPEVEVCHGGQGHGVVRVELQRSRVVFARGYVEPLGEEGEAPQVVGAGALARGQTIIDECRREISSGQRVVFFP